MEVPYKEVPASEAKPLLDQDRSIIVDLRQRERFEMEHMRGAINIPIRALWSEGPGDLPRDRGIVLVCEDGIDSMVAAELLLAKGFSPESLISIIDGLEGWRKAGFPLEKRKGI